MKNLHYTIVVGDVVVYKKWEKICSPLRADISFRNFINCNIEQYTEYILVIIKNNPVVVVVRVIW